MVLPLDARVVKKVSSSRWSHSATLTNRHTSGTMSSGATGSR
jgi:hypothetical protein